MNAPEENLSSRRVCATCVREEFLRDLILRIGEESECFYCHDFSNTFDLEEMADRIEKAIDEHFQRTSPEPSDWEYLMIKEVDNYFWERSGEEIGALIGDVARVGTAISADILAVLQDRHYSHEHAEMRDEAAFDSQAHYEEKPADDAEYRDQWSIFETALKTTTRFFSRSAQTTLGTLFKGLDDLRTREGRPAICNAGPEAPLTAVYRARVFQSNERLEEALRRPEQEVGPPPSLAAVAGRMNADGISVFYGATDANTALAEVRPPVGSRVAIGKFNIIRPLRLLDLDALRAVFVPGSFFDPDYLRRLERAKFLAALSEQMTRPVMPDDEPFEYLVTQAISDYLAAEANLDGIIYPSAQVEHPHANVVLFHRAARVKLLELPNGTTFSVQMEHYTEEGSEVDYWVWERIPPLPEEKPGTASQPLELSTEVLAALMSLKTDDRPVTLEFDRETLDIHHVSAVEVVAQTYSVSRHRSAEPT